MTTEFPCKHCGLAIEWVSALGSIFGKGLGYWSHPARVDANKPGMRCGDSDETAEPFTRIVEIVCVNEHCWVPGTLVVNSAGEHHGQRLSAEFCPVCAGAPAHTYTEPLPFNPVAELAAYRDWYNSDRMGS